MAKKERRAIKQQLAIFTNEVWQDRPYTAVKVYARFRDYDYVAIGFCKVCWPDWWNRDRGVQIAKGRALDKIARQIEGEFCGEGDGPTPDEYAVAFSESEGEN